MNPIMLFTVIGEVPVLDWKGPEFLGFYVVCYIAALVWAIWHRRRRFAKFTVPQADLSSLADPYEAAYLAGGIPRCAQLAVVRLLERGDVEWKSSWGRSNLVAKGASHPAMTEIESKIFEAVVEKRKAGLSLSEIPQIIAPRLGGVESRLAIMGLRPTSDERAGIKVGGIVPLILLLIIGGIKLLIGLDRERPIILLVMCMVATFVTIIILLNYRKFLTPAGEEVLAGMRQRLVGTEKNSENLSQTVALMGVAGVFGYSHLLAMDEGMRKDLTAMSHSPTNGGGSGGCSTSGGCSSGCGGGGGGGGCGGGCGGCGGGD